MTKIKYAKAKGVLNTEVTNHAGDFAAFVDAHKTPQAVTLSAPGYHAATKRVQGDTKKTLAYFVGGAIEGKRHDDNVRSRTMLTLDIEATGKQKEQPPPPQDVLAKLEDLGRAGWVYTSLSHKEDAPRYRVVLPLSKPIEGKALEASTRKAAKALGIEAWCQPESWVLSQPMYLPAKLKGGKFWQRSAEGRAWTAAPADIPDKVVADIPEGKHDPVLNGLRRAGLYLREDEGQKGKHYITCPFVDQHGTENDTQTVYYEAHHDGNPRPAVKCFDTEPDDGGKPHLTYTKLVNWLRENGHLARTDEDANTSSALEDIDTAWDNGAIGPMLDAAPTKRVFVIDKLCPAGVVTVLAGPGGVSKSSLMLRLLYAAATGTRFGPFEAPRAVRCAYVSYEDDQQAVHERLHKIDRADSKDAEVNRLLYNMDLVRENLRVFPVAQQAAQWLLMTEAYRGQATPTARVQWLREFLLTHKVKLLVLDPAAYIHTLEENDNGAIAQLMQMLGHVAAEAECAIVLLHHTGKGAQFATLDDVNQGSVRGASAFVDNARSAAVLVSMPQKEASRFGLTPDALTPSTYAVFKHVKHNYSGSLGMHVFHRDGPLLTHRADLQPLSGAALEEANAERAALAKAASLTSQAVKAMRWLADSNGEPASTRMIIAGAGLNKNKTKETFAHAEEQGWLASSPGVGGGTVWRLTKDGHKQLALFDKEAGKRKK